MGLEKDLGFDQSPKISEGIVNKSLKSEKLKPWLLL